MQILTLNHEDCLGAMRPTLFRPGVSYNTYPQTKLPATLKLLALSLAAVRMYSDRSVAMAVKISVGDIEGIE